MATKPNIWSALAAVQEGMGGVTKDGRGNRNRYITLDHLLSVARPLCKANDLCLVHDAQHRDGLLVVRTGVVHVSGESHWLEIPIAPQDPGSKGGVAFSPWALGSAVTYGRRYGLSCLLAVSSLEDDDGAQAQSEAPAKAAPPAAPKPDARKEHRAALLGSVIKSGKVLGMFLADAPSKPHRDNIEVLQLMVGEGMGLPFDTSPNLREVSDDELTKARDYWRVKRDAKLNLANGDLPL